MFTQATTCGNSGAVYLVLYTLSSSVKPAYPSSRFSHSLRSLVYGYHIASMTAKCRLVKITPLIISSVKFPPFGQSFDYVNMKYRAPQNISRSYSVTLALMSKAWFVYSCVKSFPHTHKNSLSIKLGQ